MERIKPTMDNTRGKKTKNLDNMATMYLATAQTVYPQVKLQRVLK
jgi:hypothetical protein